MSCLYFHEDRISDEKLKDLIATRTAHPSVHVQKTDYAIREDGGTNKIVLTYRPDIRLGASFSFITPVKQQESYAHHEGAFPPVRSGDLIGLTRDFMKWVDKKATEPEEAETSPS
jgi:hypothetical protein